MLILIIIGVTIFFCHSLIRLCMLAVKARKREQAAQQGQLTVTPEMVGPGGYAIPAEPIPVVLARDEEAAGIESEATKTGPPAYGVWRESVVCIVCSWCLGIADREQRVDPNRLYWARNEHAPRVDEVSEVSSLGDSGSTPSGSSRSGAPRPPSYSSDDGVSYVVDARPRSIAPTGTLSSSSQFSSPQSSVSGRPDGSWV
ncbi:hypothetical protein VTI74DRAFT_11675 [Chaetomium olivicolor]